MWLLWGKYISCLYLLVERNISLKWREWSVASLWQVYKLLVSPGQAKNSFLIQYTRLEWYSLGGNIKAHKPYQFCTWVLKGMPTKSVTSFFQFKYQTPFLITLITGMLWLFEPVFVHRTCDNADWSYTLRDCTHSFLHDPFYSSANTNNVLSIRVNEWSEYILCRQKVTW